MQVYTLPSFHRQILGTVPRRMADDAGNPGSAYGSGGSAVDVSALDLDTSSPEDTYTPYPTAGAMRAGGSALTTSNAITPAQIAATGGTSSSSTDNSALSSILTSAVSAAKSALGLSTTRSSILPASMPSWVIPAGIGLVALLIFTGSRK